MDTGIAPSAFFALVDRAFERHKKAIEMVRGSILLHVFDAQTRTIVTSGARKGIYREATDDLIDCALYCEDWVLSALIDPNAEVDLGELHEDGVLVLEGDVSVLRRFLDLTQPQKALSVRAGGAYAKQTLRRKKRR